MALGIKLGIIASTFPQTPSFTNTYSLSMDGVDDTVNFQNEWFAPSTPSQTTGNTVGTISFWVKLPTNISSGGLMGMVSINVGSNSKPLIWLLFNRSASSTGRYIRAYVSGANSTQTGVLQNQQFFIYDDSSTTYPNSGITFSADTWYHIAVVHDKDATNRYKAYINGNEFLIPNTTGTGSNGERTIGEMPYSLPYNPTAFGITPNVDLGFSRTSSSGGLQYFEGNLDEVAFWNSALTSENVTSIYNSGVPNDLTSLNPVAWYRNGDNGTWKSPQWLIPNNSNVANSRFSNYSFEYDGVDDYVQAPLDGTSTGGILAASDSDVELTISFWFKLNAGANPAGVFQWANSLSDGTPFLLLQQNLIPTNVKFVIDGGFRTPINVNLSQWYNMTLTRTASDNTWRAYLDGVEVISYDDGGTITNRASATDIYLGNGYGGYSPCNIDEFAVWNSVQDVATIYNSGVPTDISSLSPVGYWRSENSTFLTNWTVTDNGSGGNDGTSANMTIEDRVGDAPNSSNNAVSFNMDEVDRETDVPT